MDMARRILAIANFRVSSDEQLLNNSLPRQERAVRKAAKELDVEIVRFWSGSVSSKKWSNLERKDLEQMIQECKKNRQIKYAIFDEVDRFMRSMLEIGYFIVEFKKLGVEVKFASQPNLKTDTAANTLMLMLEAYKAEGSNEERQRKSIAGQTTALLEGRYTFRPKPGYMKGQKVGVHEVHPTKGPILKRILIRIATHQISPSQALVELNQSEFTGGRSRYKMDKFRPIVIDPYYAGIVEMDKQVKARNENGLHEPLVTRQQHLELVKIMELKKKNQAGPRKNGNPKYPCNNIVSHIACEEKRNGRVVGFDNDNGKNKAVIYEKYRCRACGKYWHRDDMHTAIAKQFENNPLSDEGVADLVEALKIVWKQRQGDATQEATRISRRIDSLNEVISTRALAAIEPSNAPIKAEIMNAIANEKQEVEQLKENLSKLRQNADGDQERFIEFALGFARSMGSRFLDPSLSQENRLKCKQIIFPGGFWINDNKKVYTPQISPLIRLASNKKDLPEIEKSSLVRVRRL
jgi:DNA invertase Pin-like site-specific DNA recombinase